MKLMTTSASLSTSAFFTPSIFSFQRANNELATSVARLSSGTRITSASDDVAALSIATRLKSQLSGLKQASYNVAQADSMLQVANGGLTEIGELLDRLSSISAQANTTSLTAADRSFLQEQFAQYLEEIDRISSNTSFNGINLLNGTLSGENKAITQTEGATKAEGTLTFTADVGNGETIVLNGVTFTEGVDFDSGVSAQATIDDLITALEASTDTRISQASYERVANSLVITAKSGGTAGNQYIINESASTAAARFTVAGAATNSANVYTLEGGLDDGLHTNSVKGVGTIGDALVTAQSQVASSVTLFITGTISNNETLQLDNGIGGLITFTFKSAATPGGTEIQIGDTVEETLQNAIDTIKTYSAANAGDNNYGLRQLDFKVDGNNLVITNRTVGNATDLSGAALDIAEGMANATLSGSSFNNGATTGINTSGVNNADFVGTIEGFSATYNSNDNIDLSLTVGSHTYTATISDTTPVGATTVRFSSEDGGYFDVQIAAAGLAVGNQDAADTFADRLNAAFSSLDFYQDRKVTNFSATGDFIGGSASIQLGNFSSVRIDNIKVTAPTSSAGDATIDITINGTVFRASSGIGSGLGAHESLTFVSLTDASQTITLVNGTTAQDFSDADAAADFQASLREAFGLGEGTGGVDFQVGTSPTDVVNVVVNNASTDTLFSGVTPDVTSQANAAAAQTLLITAKNAVLSIISNVGALQSRFSSALNSINSSTEGLEAAKSNLIDTDIVAESTAFAQSQLKINAGVAVIAQARSLQSSLLGLLHFSNN